jgi:hypothetical protein
MILQGNCTKPNSAAGASYLCYGEKGVRSREARWGGTAHRGEVVLTSDMTPRKNRSGS